MAYPHDKPEAEKLGWRIERSEALYQGHTSTYRQDAVRVEEKQINYQYEERADAVIIVPVTANGEIVLIRQYRYPVDAWCLETPAGGCHDCGDLSLEEVVRKELREEVGAEARTVEQVGWFYSAPAFASEKAWIYIAWDVQIVAPADTEQTEELRTRKVPLGEALQSARSGEMVTAPCALALLRCESALRSRFPV